MIAPNELRIGNFVLNKDGQIITVENVNDQGINGEWDAEWCAYGSDEIDPVPLTSEILERIKIKGKHFCDEFFIETNPSGVLIGQRPHGVKYLRHIKYVHQFQNLYFDLTSEEFPIVLTQTEDK